MPFQYLAMWRKARQETVTGVEVAAGPAVLLQRLSSRVRLKKTTASSCARWRATCTPNGIFYIYYIYMICELARPLV